MDLAAKHLIYSLFDWMREDHMNRVTMVDRSPKELKEKLGANGRTRWFSTENGNAHINLFDDYVQIWDEKNNCLGDYDWFYLAASIQSMWNVVILEKVQEKESKDGCKMEVKESKIVPAQTEENKARNPDAWPSDLQDIPIPSMTAIKDYLTEEEKILKDYLECAGLPKQLILRQQLKVAGLRMIRNLTEDAIEEETEQPELPRLKNNDERKEWLRNYKTWPLCHVDIYTGAKYYEYRFDNGAVLVVEEWKTEGDRYIPDHETVYLHLIGGPEAPRGQYGTRKWETHEKFNRFPDSETAIVEFLKAAQK